MPKFTILLCSKNKKTINHSLNFFKNSEKQNIRITKKLLQKKKKKNKISILKSPHVNKTAQKHFQFIYFFTSLSFETYALQKNLILLKRIKQQLFPDLKILIKVTYKKRKFFSFKKITFSYLKFEKKGKKRFNPLFLGHDNLFTKTISHIKILDYFGGENIILP
jgi:ribosomal protein S10